MNDDMRVFRPEAERGLSSMADLARLPALRIRVRIFRKMQVNGLGTLSANFVR